MPENEEICIINSREIQKAGHRDEKGDGLQDKVDNQICGKDEDVAQQLGT